MGKKLVLLSKLTFSVMPTLAQDIITRSNGAMIKANVSGSFIWQLLSILLIQKISTNIIYLTGVGHKNWEAGFEIILSVFL
jgi:hypothetical protein